MIIWFSGTGNSHYVAEEIGKRLCDDNLYELRGDVLIDPSSVTIDAKDSKRIIWVFPTYSWGVPPVVVRFIKEVNLINNQESKHYMVTTCGDDIGQTAEQWRKLVRHRQWQSASAFSVTMPNTYVLMKGFDVDSKKDAEQKLLKAPAAIDNISRRIEQDIDGDIVVKGSWPRIKSHIIYPWFVRFCMSPKPFRSNGRCIGCGRCARSCPMSNITMENNTPQWHSRCALCLRCYHICPYDAVCYGTATKGKGQYFLK